MKIKRKDPDPIPTPPPTYDLVGLTQQEMECLLEISKVPKYPSFINPDTERVPPNNGVEISKLSVHFAVILERMVEKALRDARFFEVNEEY